MKAAENIMLGIWCAAATFVTPVWLTVGFLDITGLIYQYDGMVDEGTAGIMGVIELTLWGLFVLLPDIWFLKRMKSQGWRKVCYALGGMAVLILLCLSLCKWNMIRFVAG